MLLLYGKMYIYGVSEADGVARHRQYCADKDGVYGLCAGFNRAVNQYSVADEDSVGPHRDFRYAEVRAGAAFRDKGHGQGQHCDGQCRNQDCRDGRFHSVSG